MDMPFSLVSPLFCLLLLAFQCSSHRALASPPHGCRRSGRASEKGRPQLGRRPWKGQGCVDPLEEGSPDEDCSSIAHRHGLSNPPCHIPFPASRRNCSHLFNLALMSLLHLSILWLPSEATPAPAPAQLAPSSQRLRANPPSAGVVPPSTPSITPPPQSSSSKTEAVTIAVVVTAGVTLVFAVIVFYFYQRLRPSIKVQEAVHVRDDKPLLDGSSKNPLLWSSVGKDKEGSPSIATHFENPVIVIYSQPADSILTVEKKVSNGGSMHFKDSIAKIPEGSDDVMTKGASVMRASKGSDDVATKDNSIMKVSRSAHDARTKDKGSGLRTSPEDNYSVYNSNSLSTSLAEENKNIRALDSVPKNSRMTTLSASFSETVHSHPAMPPTLVGHPNLQAQPTLNSVVLPSAHSSSIPLPLPPASLSLYIANTTDTLGKFATPLSTPPASTDSFPLVAVQPPPPPPPPPSLQPPASSDSFSLVAAEVPPPSYLPPRSSSTASVDSFSLCTTAPAPPPLPQFRSAQLPSLPPVPSSRGPPVPPLQLPVTKATVPHPPAPQISGARGPPAPPPPPAVRKEGLVNAIPPPLKPSLPQQPPSKGKSNADDSKPKLKPLHWDKVKADPSHSMVWDKLRMGSFELNEEVIETLFGYNSTVASKDAVKPSSSSAAKKPGILDAKKAQNIAIQLRALNLRKEDICDALFEGDGLSCELLEVLVKMAPTQEEQKRLQAFSGDHSELGSAEHFLKAVLQVPFAFERLKAMLFKACFKDDLIHAQECLQTLEVACTEVRNSRLFLKLLEAVLKMGNRMNAGTFRGEADAFKLDALLRLSDVKSADGKTTLLHFVVEEVIRAEGVRAVRVRSEANAVSEIQKSDDEYKSIGLQVVSSLSSELGSVRKAAGVDADALSQAISKLVSGLDYIKMVLQTQFQSQIGNMSYLAGEDNFVQHMELFVKQTEEDVSNIQAEFSKVLDEVKQATAYFHGNLGERQPLRLFMIVNDFFQMLERACADVARTLKLNPHS